MHRKSRVERGFDRCQYHPQVLGLAARHHRVDRDFFYRQRHQIWRAQTQHFLRIPGRSRQHAHHALLRRRHHGQTIGPTAFVDRFDLVLIVAKCHAAGCQTGLAETDQQIFPGARLQIHRAASWPHRRQASTEALHTADALPFGTVPAISARDFLAGDATNQRRDDLDAQAMRNAQVGIVHPPSDRLWKGGVVLGIDHQPALRGRLRQLRQHWHGEFTGRAISFDHRDQTIGGP